ncbi:MAG: dihydrodipicolinate synthase family protein [Oscillospiraceae bacterium]|jgi:4-hydroxy-tetrahydrodipicolinate synthase|nr:dihydrodipicolinate synthase family protein [Oscillospiraceae bacterium]
MPSAKDFRGVYALLLTPFTRAKEVDYKAYEGYVEWQVSHRPNALFGVCGSSEMVYLTLAEREKLAALAVKHAGATPVVATANLEPSWEAQVEEVKRITATGVQGLIFVTKGYGDDQERMFTYLTELASHTPLPIVLYEFPGASPHRMSGETFGRLAATGKFVAVKDTTCTMAGIGEKIAVQGESAVLQANIPLLQDAYEAGARGVAATTTTCGAQLFVRQWAAFQKGDLAAARLAHKHILLLDDVLAGHFTASAKYLAGLQGAAMEWVTRSGQTLNEQRLRAIELWYDWAKPILL